MIPLRSVFLLSFMCMLSVLAAQTVNHKVLTVPAVSEYCRIDEKGYSVLPSGRLVHPAGEMIRITHDPFGMSLSPDGKTAVTLHNGVFTIIDLATLQHTRVPSYDGKISSPLSNGSFIGVAFGPDSRTIFLSGGDNGAVIIYDIKTFQKIDSISLNGAVNGKYFNDSFTADLLFNSNENELLVLDRGNFRLVRIDLKTRKLKSSVPVGRQPFGLAMSPDQSLVLVANAGMYSYPLVAGMDSTNHNQMMINWHPYGDNSKEAIEGTVIDGKKIPGVGSPNAPEAMSVFVIDLAKDKVRYKLKTGFQVGQIIEEAEVVGGASPNSIAVGSRFAYVSNATNDNISVIDFKKGKIVSHIPIKVHKELDRYRGLLPFGLSLSPDEKTLYVALLGFNAVAVIDLPSGKTRGLIPTGWGTSRVL
ncbi:MAG TPA: phosphoesterase, partial [Chitinophagaceae bacterium]|nr:phosphoesterase [Chitinophagaceae bacterium]